MLKEGSRSRSKVTSAGCKRGADAAAETVAVAPPKGILRAAFSPALQAPKEGGSKARC
jgi:hypothetical protein